MKRISGEILWGAVEFLCEEAPYQVLAEINMFSMEVCEEITILL